MGKYIPGRHIYAYVLMLQDHDQDINLVRHDTKKHYLITTDKLHQFEFQVSKISSLRDRELIVSAQ